MKYLPKNSVKHILFTALGALIGLFYYRAVGCASGTCMLTSSLSSSVLYFAVIGLWISWITSGGCCCGGACSYDPNEKK